MLSRLIGGQHYLVAMVGHASAVCTVHADCTSHVHVQVFYAYTHTHTHTHTHVLYRRTKRCSLYGSQGVGLELKV